MTLLNVGIDLGTSICTCWVWYSNGGKLAVFDTSNLSLPSTVFYKNDNSITIGKKQEEMVSNADGWFISNWKEYIGLAYDSNKVIDALHSTDGMKVDKDGFFYLIKRNGVSFKRTVADVATDYLTKLFGMVSSTTQAESGATPPVSVAIGVPTSFSTDQREKLESVVQNSGIHNARFVEEPLAAVLSFTSLTEKTSKLFLVCDIGMGVFRTSLVQQEGNVFFLLGKANQDYLGANKIDRFLLEYIEKRIQDSKSSEMIDCLNSLKENSIKWKQLLYEVVNMKETLSKSESYDFNFEKIHLTVLQSELEAVIHDTVLDMIEIADNLLHSFNMEKDNYLSVLLMGGSCLLPRLIETFQAHFNPIRCSFLERDAVAKGCLLACYYGSSITISKRPLRGVKKLNPQKEGVLYPNNVLPEPISIRREDGSCRQLLHQNEPLETEASINLYPLNYGQSIMRLDFCQGPSSVFSDNTPIGTIQYTPDQVYSKGDPSFKVRVSIDKWGVLSCSIMDPKTGKETTKTLRIPRSSIVAPNVSTRMLEKYQQLLQEVTKLRRKTTRRFYSSITYRMHVIKQKYTEGAPLDELIKLCEGILKDYDEQMTHGDTPPSFEECVSNLGNNAGARSFIIYNIKSKEVNGIIWNGSDAILVKREYSRQTCVIFDPKEKRMTEYEQEWKGEQARGDNLTEGRDERMKELPPGQQGHLDLDGNQTWEGGVKDGMMNGYGILYNEHGRKKYEGFMWNGKKNGWGWQYYDDVELIEYDGCFYDDTKWGYGTEREKTGAMRYCDYWMNGHHYPEEVKEGSMEICSQQKEATFCCSPDMSSFELAKWIETLENLSIKDMSFQQVTRFSLEGLSRLKTLVIGKDSFAEDRDHNVDTIESKDSACFRIVKCPVLSSIRIGKYSFYDYSSFVLKDLSELESIELGEKSFYRVSSLSLNNLPKLRFIHLGKLSFQNSHSFAFRDNFRRIRSVNFENIPQLSLQGVQFEDDCLVYTYSLQSSGTYTPISSSFDALDLQTAIDSQSSSGLYTTAVNILKIAKGCYDLMVSEMAESGLIKKRFMIENDYFGSVRSFMLDGLNELESVNIDMRSVGISSNKRSDGDCRIVNCPKLQSIQIGDYSFPDYHTLELSGLSSLKSICIGESCFEGVSSFSLTGLID